VHRTPYPPAPVSPFQICMRDRNRRRLARLHFGFFARARFLAWFVPTRVVLALNYLLRGDMKRVQAVIRGAIER